MLQPFVEEPLRVLSLGLVFGKRRGPEGVCLRTDTVRHVLQPLYVLSVLQTLLEPQRSAFPAHVSGRFAGRVSTRCPLLL